MPKPPSRKIGDPVGRVYLGIDPGKKGGLATVTQGGVVTGYHVMPGADRDLWNLVSGFKGVSFACLEKVHAMPGQGVTSMFTFGKGYGGLRMALTAAGIPYLEVRPQEWMKALGIPPRKTKGKGVEGRTQYKERLRVKCQQMFPSLEVWDRPKSKGVQQSICDALLIAEYARQVRNV